MSLRQIILVVLALLISAFIQAGLAGWDGMPPTWPLPPLFPEPPAEEPLLVYSTNDVSATIPESVTRIDHGAFSNCVSLAGVYFQGSPPETLGQWQSKPLKQYKNT